MPRRRRNAARAKAAAPTKRDFTRAQAQQRADDLTRALVRAGVVTTSEDLIFAGSLRRREDTVRDLDALLVDIPDDRWARLEEVAGLALTRYGDAQAQGLFDGIQVDVRRVACDHLGAALEYFTGPRGHNIGMRTKAKRQGRKLSEYGLFDATSGAKIAGRTERGIYDALGHEMKRPGDRRENPGGDIWDFHQGSAWIVIPTNGALKKDGTAVMGKGLAKQAAQRYPDLAAELGERLRLAQRSYPDRPLAWNKPFRFDQYHLYTFPTKFDWRAPSDLALIEASAKHLHNLILNWAESAPTLPLYIRQAWGGGDRRVEASRVTDRECPVFMPHVGTGAGGLDWADVEPIIRRQLGALVTLVPPATPGKPPRTRAPKKKPTRLTKPARRRAPATVRANPPAPDAWRGDAAHAWVWPVVDHNLDALTAYLAPWGTPDWDAVLGCGAMGCVVPFLDHAGLVVKITTDETEGALTQRILERGLDRRYPGLTRIAGLRRLHVPPGLAAVSVPAGLTDYVGEDEVEVLCAFVIVREDVVPWSAAGALAYARSLGDAGIIAPDADGQYTVPWYPALNGIMAAGEIRDAVAFEAHCRLLAQFPETHALAQAIWGLWTDAGIFIADQHFDNLGFRQHAQPGAPMVMVPWLDGQQRPPLLTLDIGQSDIPGVDLDDPDACAVVPPLVRANPWLPKSLRQIPPIP